MPYEVIYGYTFFRGKDKHIFDSYDEIAEYFHYEILCNNFYEVRIIDCYDRQRIDPTEIIGIARRKLDQHRSENYLKRHGPYEFRNGPVPNIHKGWSNRGSYNRYPRTKQLRTEAFFLDVDEDIRYYKIKTKTKNKFLPTSWDDVHKCRTRNWKSYRNTQWK